MEPTDRVTCIALAAVPGIGRRTVVKIQAWAEVHALSLAEWWHASDSLSARSGCSESQQNSLKLFKRSFEPAFYLEHLAEKNIRPLVSGDEQYPQLLSEIPDAPVVLFSLGNLGILSPKSIAVVGTRRMTGYGRLATTTLTRELVVWGATIVSGFMYGVDVTAHRAALESGGQTVAVLGYGFEQIVPRAHRRLFDEWQERPCLFLSEYPPETAPHAGNFVLRNRIIAGLSQATVVTEAAVRSGSHITVQYALEYGRVVGAVPGPITNSYSEGTKALINEGALLVSSARDVVAELREWDEIASPAPSGVSAEESASSRLEQQIITLLRQCPRQPEGLAQELRVSLSQLMATLTLLELSQSARRHGQLWYPQ